MTVHIDVRSSDADHADTLLDISIRDAALDRATQAAQYGVVEADLDTLLAAAQKVYNFYVGEGDSLGQVDIEELSLPADEDAPEESAPAQEPAPEEPAAEQRTASTGGIAEQASAWFRSELDRVIASKGLTDSSTVSVQQVRTEIDGVLARARTQFGSDIDSAVDAFKTGLDAAVRSSGASNYTQLSVSDAKSRVLTVLDQVVSANS